MKQIHLLLLLFFLLIGIVSCTKNFTEINTTPNGITPDRVIPSDGTSTETLPNYLVAQMQYIHFGGGNAWLYQAAQNLNLDVYAGYWILSNSTGYGTGVNNAGCFTLTPGWDGQIFWAWKSSMPSYLSIKYIADSTKTLDDKAVLGMSLVVKVLMSARTGDAIGTLPYKNYGSLTLPSIPYDNLDTMYYMFFRELDTAITYLTANGVTPITPNASDRTDVFYAGDVSKWAKLANSMKLRLGMRLAKVKPDKAKEVVQQAIDKNLFILTNDDNAYFRSLSNEPAITTMTRTWGFGSAAVGAAVQSFLQGWNDPRLDVFISKTSERDKNLASDRIALGNYVSKRLGTSGISGAPDPRVYSLPGTGIPPEGTFLASKPESGCFFNAAETKLLLAEAALRGWYTTANAKELYEDGIKLSMEQWGITDGATISAYLSSSATPANYTDPASAVIDIATTSTCKPSWDAVNSNEAHLEQIITQKWLALWPVNSPEAWSEYRRTGYPYIFPPYTSGIPPTTRWGGLTVNSARKIGLPQSEYENTATRPEIDDAISKFFTRSVIPGQTPGDNIYTPVWWDVDAPNF